MKSCYTGVGSTASMPGVLVRTGGPGKAVWRWRQRLQLCYNKAGTPWLRHRQKEALSPDPPGKQGPPVSPAEREHIPGVSNHQVCGN